MKNLLIFLCLLISFATFATGNPCKGTTAKGIACSRVVKEGSYCFQHNPSSLHCGAVTKAGGQCKRVVKKAGHCSQHSQ